MKIGLYGGTFDPIHNGHIALCEAFRKELGLDRIILMPTAQPPHKLKAEMAPAAHRAAMCELAAEPYPFLTVSRVEIARGGASFTADTLDIMMARYKDAEWHLLMGADMFLTVSTWFRYEDIRKNAVLCTVPRDDVSLETLKAHAAKLTEDGARCIVVPANTPRISSTALRKAVSDQDNRNWRRFVPASVADYIEDHDLYLPDSMAEVPTTNEQYIAILKRRLTPYRFEHSLAVADEAKRLAPLYGADPEKAYTAGLLHDIMKDASPAEQTGVLESFGVTLDPDTMDAPKLWHAAIGAVFLEHVLGIADPDMLNAVRYHTTARAGMTPLEKTVYIADFTAAGRHYPDVAEMRRRADISSDEAMRYAVRYSINELKEKGREPHPDTLAAQAELQRNSTSYTKG